MKKILSILMFAFSFSNVAFSQGTIKTEQPYNERLDVFKGSFVYFDGNGNKYYLKQNVLKYFPVKPSESSSGDYDGGEEFTKYLNAAQHQKLSSLFFKLIILKTCHTTQNIKPNCTIKLLQRQGNKEFIIKATCKENMEVLTFLKNIQ